MGKLLNVEIYDTLKDAIYYVDYVDLPFFKNKGGRTYVTYHGCYSTLKDNVLGFISFSIWGYSENILKNNVFIYKVTKIENFFLLENKIEEILKRDDISELKIEITT